jgi:hypothetical protein
LNLPSLSESFDAFSEKINEWASPISDEDDDDVALFHSHRSQSSEVGEQVSLRVFASFFVEVIRWIRPDYRGSVAHFVTSKWKPLDRGDDRGASGVPGKESSLHEGDVSHRTFPRTKLSNASVHQSKVLRRGPVD